RSFHLRLEQLIECLVLSDGEMILPVSNFTLSHELADLFVKRRSSIYHFVFPHRRERAVLDNSRSLLVSEGNTNEFFDFLYLTY
ncbi:hypothetical protein PMAYCL1PPCAC_00147, partial [Pristionchus mayeri]